MLCRTLTVVKFVTNLNVAKMKELMYQLRKAGRYPKIYPLHTCIPTTKSKYRGILYKI